jgi:hypothetical protein
MRSHQEVQRHTTTEARPQARSLNLIIGTIAMCVITTNASAQAAKQATKFPPKGWESIKLSDQQRSRLRWSVTRELTPKNTYRLTIKRPAGYTEAVITDPQGAILGRDTAEGIDLPQRQIGDRYIIYFCKSEERRALRFLEEFIEYPNSEFPAKGWQPRKDSMLPVKEPKQITPKSMIEAFTKPHSMRFSTTASDKACVYLMAKLEAGGKERVASQSLDGDLAFWMHARRGESFRIYQLFPDNKTYRRSQTMTVEKSFPLGK